MSAAAPSATHEPTPRRRRVSPWLLLGSLAVSPAAWITQLVIGYGVSSYACFPYRSPWLISPPPGWSGEAFWLTVINLVCLALALGAGAGLSWRHWRLARGEKPADAESLPAIVQGRTRFLAACGILAGVGFSIAIAFDTLEPSLLASCWRIAT